MPTVKVNNFSQGFQFQSVLKVQKGKCRKQNYFGEAKINLPYSTNVLLSL